MRHNISHDSKSHPSSLASHHSHSNFLPFHGASNRCWPEYSGMLQLYQAAVTSKPTWSLRKRPNESMPLARKPKKMSQKLEIDARCFVTVVWMSYGWVCRDSPCTSHLDEIPPGNYMGVVPFSGARRKSVRSAHRTLRIIELQEICVQLTFLLGQTWSITYFLLDFVSCFSIDSNQTWRLSSWPMGKSVSPKRVQASCRSSQPIWNSLTVVSEMAQTLKDVVYIGVHMFHLLDPFQDCAIYSETTVYIKSPQGQTMPVCY